jgi:hypothetical protein
VQNQYGMETRADRLFTRCPLLVTNTNVKLKFLTSGVYVNVMKGNLNSSVDIV